MIPVEHGLPGLGRAPEKGAVDYSGSDLSGAGRTCPAIFKQLRIVDAPGSPTFGESCAQWVFDLVAALFGSYDAQTGVRHIKEVLSLSPRKTASPRWLPGS